MASPCAMPINLHIFVKIGGICKVRERSATHFVASLLNY